jgi:dienelactone hydrolase
MKQRYDIFLLIGQSNMAGRGRLADVPALTHSRVFMFRDMAWRQAEEPLHTDKPTIAGVGLGMSFAAEMAADLPEASIGLVACAVGGTPLSRWMPGNDLYENAVAIARRALEDGTLRGILWHQGEGDSGTRELAEDYGLRFERMIRQLRADLKAEQVPVLAGELGEFLRERPGPDAFHERVNQELQGLVGRIPAYACVSSGGLSDNGDHLHFNAVSLREFGVRYAAKYRELRTMKAGPEALHLSPSEYHRNLMLSHPPALRYDGGKVKAWQTRLGRKVKQLVGDWPEERCALNVRQLWLRDHPLGTIEKIAFTSEPYADVVAYVCLPKGVTPPYPFMICLQGHSTGMHNSIAVKLEDNALPHEVAGDRDFALGCLRNGMAALCIEQRSFGEREEKQMIRPSKIRCHDATMHALMLGKTLIGERVYDVDRGLDYLAARGDVDMDCVGVMGNSGGGTISLFAAALLPRLAFAMPSCYFCTFRDSIMSVFHCMDNYIPGLLRYAEMPDVMGLFAPKPVVVVAGREDNIFPIEATRAAFKDLQRIYEACGASDRCHLVVGNEGHRFYANDAWPVMRAEIDRVLAARRKPSGRRGR